LHEALDFLTWHGHETSVLAGGTDLMIAVRSGELKSRFVMDVSRLDELRTIENQKGKLAIGAAVTFTEIADSPEVNQCAPVLARAARCVGSAQIRNLGTMGGNVGNASPAADSVPPLVVHAARVDIRSASSERTPLVEEFITAPYRTDRKPTELIVRFLLEPIEPGYRWGFHRIARRRALAIARANASAVGKLTPDGAVGDVKLSVGSITPQPCRMTPAEGHLLGKVPDLSLIREAASKVSQEMIRRSGVRPTTEYKRPAVEGLVIKVLSEIFLDEAPHE
jgi:CO/xanthine dehydrogenase FAD-binding subunit